MGGCGRECPPTRVGVLFVPLPPLPHGRYRGSGRRFPGDTSSLFGPPPLTMLSVLLWCLWLLSYATSCSIFGLIKVAPLPHIDVHLRQSHLIVRCVVTLCCRYMHPPRPGVTTMQSVMMSTISPPLTSYKLSSPHVSIHNLCTVAPCYGELLALLVYLT